MVGVTTPLRGSVPGEDDAISSVRLVAELQSMALAIRMFGLDGFANMSAERAKETPEIEQVKR